MNFTRMPKALAQLLYQFSIVEIKHKHMQNVGVLDLACLPVNILSDIFVTF